MTPYEQQILKAFERPVSAHDVPAVGKVYMREMSLDERDAVNKRLLGPKLDGAAPANAWAAATVAGTLCTEGGERLSGDFARAIMEGGQKHVAALFKVAQQVNGTDEASREEAEKNSEATQASGSDTG